ncbi:MAG: rhomboid family intramembrane serine protease [Bacteroidales bacterium]|nr:rhomboid family intramembrane serine protease [Bacteroidales bacterium]
MYNFGRGFSNIPPVTKNLILINVVMLLASMGGASIFNVNLNQALGLHFPKSELFQPYQIVTHMFMHGGLAHLFFNMFALYMFGRVLESTWGPKRFFIYYIVTGLGAAFTHEAVIAIEYYQLIADIPPELLETVKSKGAEILSQGQNFTNPAAGKLNLLLYAPTVGASGAVFGILLAFGMLFPNTQLLLLFPPIPIKAKWMVIGYGAIELYLAVTQPGSSIAHAAHLGGMLFGYILIKYWRKTTKTLY